MCILTKLWMALHGRFVLLSVGLPVQLTLDDRCSPFFGQMLASPTFGSLFWFDLNPVFVVVVVVDSPKSSAESLDNFILYRFDFIFNLFFFSRPLLFFSLHFPEIQEKGELCSSLDSIDLAYRKRSFGTVFTSTITTTTSPNTLAKVCRFGRFITWFLTTFLLFSRFSSPRNPPNQQNTHTPTRLPTYLPRPCFALSLPSSKILQRSPKSTFNTLSSSSSSSSGLWGVFVTQIPTNLLPCVTLCLCPLKVFTS